MTAAQPDTDSEDSEEDRLTLKEKFAKWRDQAQFAVHLLAVLVLLAIGFLWHRMFIVIPPGSRGVLSRTLHGGTVTGCSWGEGLHIIAPWDHLFPYETRLKQNTVNFNVLSDEGLSLGVQVVVRHRLDEGMLGHLQKDIGPDYFTRLIEPEVEAHLRRTFGSRPAHEIHASVGNVLQEMDQFPMLGRPFEKSEKGTTPRPYLYVYDLKLVSVALPKVVEEAISEKYHQEQLMLAYKDKLVREEKEADRKRVEAAGIRDFNAIAGKVSPDMLRWRSIEATFDLAKSNNSKVVVLGGGQNGVAPMVPLNLGEATPAPKEIPAQDAGH